MPATLSPRAAALDYLRQGLESGNLQPGSALPPERDIATAVGVSRTAVRWALERLQHEGQIERSSPRTLMVTARGGASWGGLAQGTVVLISARPVPQPKHRMPGWTEYIDAAVYHALAGAGRTVLTLNPNTCLKGWPEVLRALPPAAVVVPDLEAIGYAPEEIAATWQVLRALAASGTPIITYGEALADSHVDRVVSDHEAGGALLARWLLVKGRRRLLPVFPRHVADQPWAQARLRGIATACQAAGAVVLEPRWIDVERDAAQPEAFSRQVDITTGALVQDLLPAEHPDALLAVSDGYIPGLAAAVRRCGRDPQDEIILAGYDHYWPDVPERHFEDTPPAVSIDKQHAQIGAALADLALTPAIAGGRRVVITPTLAFTQAFPQSFALEPQP